MLTVNDLHVYYGAIHALKGISFEVREGEIVTLIGANGAGKTSCLQTISGLLHARRGQLNFLDMDLRKTRPHRIVEAGLAQVPEGRRIFTGLSVRDNLLLGAYTIRDRSAIHDALVKAYELFPRLHERRHQLAGTLSGGEQQMLAIARAMMSGPRLLLLDEPSMGLAPLLVREIFKIIQTINQEGTTVLLVEQNARMALQIADRAYVLKTGEITLSGSAADLLNNPAIQKAYLGA